MLPHLEEIGGTLLVLGVILVGLGLLLTFGRHLPFLGDLPGDIHFEKRGCEFHLPLGASLVVSIVLTLLANLLFWLSKE